MLNDEKKLGLIILMMIIFAKVPARHLKNKGKQRKKLLSLVFLGVLYWRALVANFSCFLPVSRVKENKGAGK
jgi:ACR3 family arsenite efflux pump ArsB